MVGGGRGLAHSSGFTSAHGLSFTLSLGLDGDPESGLHPSLSPYEPRAQDSREGGK